MDTPDSQQLRMIGRVWEASSPVETRGDDPARSLRDSPQKELKHLVHVFLN